MLWNVDAEHLIRRRQRVEVEIGGAQAVWPTLVTLKADNAREAGVALWSGEGLHVGYAPSRIEAHFAIFRKARFLAPRWRHGRPRHWSKRASRAFRGGALKLADFL